MANPEGEFKRIKASMHEAREAFVMRVKRASKSAMTLANDIKPVIGDISIEEAKQAILKEFEKELMNG